MGVDVAGRISIGFAVDWVVAVAGHADAVGCVDGVLVDGLSVRPRRREVGEV